MNQSDVELLPGLSIIIPAYNEEDRLPKYLDSIIDYLAQHNPSYEIIIVDDGSSDSTVEVVENYIRSNQRVKLVRHRENKGKGAAVRNGMLKACGRLRLFTDADGATPITELEHFRRCIESGIDVAIASRALKNNSGIVRVRLHRKIIGNIFNLLVRLVAVKGISDTQCGFKLFTEKSANSVFPLQQIDGFGFDVEILYISNKKGFRIKEIPVNWTDIKKSKVKLFQDSCRMFIDLLRIRFNDFRGLYRD